MTRKEDIFLTGFVSLLYIATFNSLFLFSPLAHILCSFWNDYIQKKGKKFFEIMETGLKM